MKNAIKSLVLILSLSLISCEEKNLEGNYNVIEVSGEDMSGHGITLNIENQEGLRVGGNNSCNTYGADITNAGSNNIEVGPIMSTKMYCQEKRDIERAYMEQLANVKSYRFSQGELHMMNESGKIIIKATKAEDK
ncbi:hypothetical protein BST97_10730 [Nonlabens spongiae]|uniref:DUF306 domain-containing protein n=1 Tax=Nonlabens spongiae TaxID=331648 RepID=A0A1W6MLH1_9FLAO|nr:META domain-containing protein [Nonlabens spongiae]ARN78422.1 hypothetical protein BST97_10730 [Nonlabens spongiae]